MAAAAPPAGPEAEREVKEPVPVEKVVAEYDDEMPKEEVDTVKESLRRSACSGSKKGGRDRTSL